MGNPLKVIIQIPCFNEEETLEVLCVKNGDGGLAVAGQLLLQKDTKKLPKTD